MTALHKNYAKQTIHFIVCKSLKLLIPNSQDRSTIPTFFACFQLVSKKSHKRALHTNIYFNVEISMNSTDMLVKNELFTYSQLNFLMQISNEDVFASKFYFFISLPTVQLNKTSV